MRISLSTLSLSNPASCFTRSHHAMKSTWLMRNRYSPTATVTSLLSSSLSWRSSSSSTSPSSPLGLSRPSRSAGYEQAFSGGAAGQKPCTLESYSMERESFDDYIRRSMNGAVEDSEDGFSVELDSAALSKGTGVPPEDFSHDPKLVIASLKRAGSQA